MNSSITPYQSQGFSLGMQTNPTQWFQCLTDPTSRMTFIFTPGAHTVLVGLLTAAGIEVFMQQMRILLMLAFVSPSPEPFTISFAHRLQGSTLLDYVKATSKHSLWRINNPWQQKLYTSVPYYGSPAEHRRIIQRSLDVRPTLINQFWFVRLSRLVL